VHGFYAVTKSLDPGGCGHSWSPDRNIETMRGEALRECRKYGPECKIVYEQ